jgi:hypothetical protein
MARVGVPLHRGQVRVGVSGRRSQRIVRGGTGVGRHGATIERRMSMKSSDERALATRGRRRLTLPPPPRPGTHSRSHSSPARSPSLTHISSSSGVYPNDPSVIFARPTHPRCLTLDHKRVTCSDSPPYHPLRALQKINRVRFYLPSPPSTTHRTPPYQSFAASRAAAAAAVECRPPASSPRSYPVRLAARPRHEGLVTASRAHHTLPSTKLPCYGAQSAGPVLVSTPSLLRLSPLTPAQ